MGDIGVPDSYEVWIQDSIAPSAIGLLNPPTTPPPRAYIRQLAFTEVSWQRIMNDVSTASVVVPRTSLRDDESFFYPRPWRNALVVFRNGYQVWSGPITSWSRTSDGDLKITAYDAAIDMKKQFVGAARNYIDEEVSQVIAQLFSDARLGEPGYAPVPLYIGASYPLSFYPGSAAFDPGPGTDPRYVDAVTTEQIGTDLFQRVWDVVADFTSKGLLYFCCANDHLYVNETGVRQQLAVGDSGWPVLTDDNVIGVPTVNCDALDVITSVTRTTEPAEQAGGYRDHAITYITGSQDPTFFGIKSFGTFDYVDGQYLYPGSSNFYPPGASPVDYLGGIPSPTGPKNVSLSTGLPTGRTKTGKLVDDPYDERATFGLLAGPKVTVEQITLASSFSHPSLADDLSNLLPGTRFSVGFSDRSPFDVPISERKLGVFPNSWRYDINGLFCVPVEAFHPWLYYADPNQLADAAQSFDWGVKSLWNSRIDHLRLVQVDVSVSASNGAFQEEVKLSLVPTIQYVLPAYDGTTSLNVTYSPGGVISVPLRARPRFVG